MDHKVSKDMISSGMTPSGEKTQADLGRTQYGSAPSPSRLMDAYHSMYQTQKEETLEEHHQKDKNGNTIPHEHEEELDEGKIPAGLQAYLDKKKGKKEDKKEMKEGAGLYANIHAKRKRGGKMRKKGAKGAPSSQDFANAAKTAKEEVDKFDIVLNHFISEGYSEKEAYSKMANLTEEQLDEFLKALAQAGMRGAESIGRATRPLVAKAAQRGSNIGKPASQRIEVTDPKPQARKPFEPKRKPFDAKKPEQKPVTSASEVVSAALSKRREEKQQRKDKLASDPKTRIDIKKKEVMQDEYQYIDEYAQLIAKGAAMLSKAAKPVMKIAKKETVKKLAGNLASGAAFSAGSNLMSGGGQQKQTTGTVSASADLFDIVKGQLLDEGLSEEEIKDIMLTLTPDEILNEISIGKMSSYISAADKDVQKTATDIQKGKSVMGDDPRVKKMTQRAKGMAMAGTKIAKKLTPPSMP